MSVKRLFVEKKKGFDTEAASYLRDFQQYLDLPATDVRVLNRYDVENIEDAEYELAIKNVFSEIPVDKTYKEKLNVPQGYLMFGTEYLPGQYDQRADSAAQCIQLLTKKEKPLVRYAKIFLVKGITEKQLDSIKQYVINPVDSCEALHKKPASLEMKLLKPSKIKVIDGFISMKKAELKTFLKEYGFAMTIDDLLVAQKYFKSEERDPTITELRMLDTYWSDHCRHTTFLTALKNVEFAADNLSMEAKKVYEEYLAARDKLGVTKDISLMDLATIYTKEAKARGELANLDESEEINACSIKHKIMTDRGEQDYLIMFKNETHNHPTEIEPFGGAATCLGGAIRDPLSGRSYVYQAMRVTGSGDPRESLADTMKYKLPQRKISREAAHGYSSYGNQIGIATGLVEEIYHEGYKAKRMEIGAVIGAAPASQVVRRAPQEGDIVVLIGGRTGRDGIGGATGSSKAHDESSTSECGAEVQKGNPVTERKLQRLFKNSEFSKLIRRCNDFGAGGVCVAIGELADGLDINLDKVPKKYEGLDGTEIAISESQERMAVVISKADEEKILKFANAENLEATVVAKVTSSPRMRLFWQGDMIADISREFLDSNGAKQSADAKVTQFGIKGIFAEETKGTAKETLLSLLSDLNICSQKGMGDMFDSTIGAATVSMPLGGKNQITPVQAMCAKIPVGEPGISAATLMSYGLDPYMLSKSPFLGAIYSVLISVAKLVASGGNTEDAWFTFQEYFERLGSDPVRWGKPLAALLGAYAAQKGLKIASIGGKDSMSGSYKDLDVPPTLCSFCVAPVHPSKVITPEFKKPGNKLYIVSIGRDVNSLPDFEDALKKYQKIREKIESKTIVSAYALTRGGVLAGAAKCAFGNGLGVKLFANDLLALTEKRYGDILVEAADITDSDFTLIGELRDTPVIEVMREKIPLEEALHAYTAPLEDVFPTGTPESGTIKIPLQEKKDVHICRYKTAIPRVVIPVFPGTNCEYDTAAAFERAGAIPRVVIIRNLNASQIEASIKALASEINHAQMIMIPGGFSGGDEPDGSGKFIAAMFRNSRIKHATHSLLHSRDGLMLGICNGFQALIKLGLLPYGEITELEPTSPTLTYNTIGRHVSTVVRTRITNASSPWLSLVSVGDVHNVAVSHGEGRFVAGSDEMEKLISNGQIATQYVDFSGEPSMDSHSNPNGSVNAIEGIFSKDGRIFGKMGHSERASKYTFKNVPGNYDQKIFESGVLYFK